MAYMSHPRLHMQSPRAISRTVELSSGRALSESPHCTSQNGLDAPGRLRPNKKQPTVFVLLELYVLEPKIT